MEERHVPESPEDSGLISVLEVAHVLPDPREIELKVAEIRSAANGGTAADLAGYPIREATRKLTAAGVVAALPAAVPGLGTGVALAVGGATITSELWFFLRNLTAMQLTVAGLFGHDVYHPDRKDELVLVWGLQTGAVVPAAEAGKRLGTRIAVSQFNKRVSGQVFKTINQRLGATVVTKWGVKRGGVAVGRLIPFGVGMAIGGGVNYLTVKSFGAAVMKYYSELLPGDQKVVVPG
jgi:hypothetical protein